MWYSVYLQSTSFLLWKQQKVPTFRLEQKICTLKKKALTQESFSGNAHRCRSKIRCTGTFWRREYFAETDATVNKKVLKAFEHGITPIICCGETLTQREQGVTMDFIRQQVKIAFQGVTADQAKTAVIAYRTNLGNRNRKNCYNSTGTGSLRRNPRMYR